MSQSKLLRCGSHNARGGSRVGLELALRPGFSPRARNATNGVICATRREARVTGFDCGAGAVLLLALPHRPGGRVPISLNALGGSSPLPSARTEQRDGKA